MRPAIYSILLIAALAATACKKSKGGGQAAPAPTPKPSPTTPPPPTPPTSQNPTVPGLNTNDPVQMLAGQWTIQLAAPYTVQNTFPGNAGGYMPNGGYGNNPNTYNPNGYGQYGNPNGYYSPNGNQIPSQPTPYDGMNGTNGSGSYGAQVSTILQFLGNNFTVTKRDLRTGQVVSQTRGTFTSSHTSVGNANANSQAMLHVDFRVEADPSSGYSPNNGQQNQFPCLARLSSESSFGQNGFGQPNNGGTYDPNTGAFVPPGTNPNMSGAVNHVRMQIRCNPMGQQRPTGFDSYSQIYVRQ